MHTVLLLVAVASVRATAQPVALDEGFPATVDSIEIHAADRALGVLIDADLGPNGRVLILDYSNTEVLAFDRSGSLQWRAGRAGRGPGEFRTIYRVATAVTGDVYVLDRFGNAVSRFETDGSFVDRRQVDFVFDHVDDMLVSSDGTIVISGTTQFGEGVRDSAVHVFDRNFEHLRSFAPLPEAADRRVLSLWGAGGLSWLGTETILYTRRLPYEIYMYTIGGRLLKRIPGAVDYDLTADDAYDITEHSGRLTIQHSENPVPALQPPKPVKGSLVLQSRRFRERRHWDLFAVDGRLLGSTEVPMEWGTVIGFDEAEDAVWLKGSLGHLPVLRKIILTFEEGSLPGGLK